MENQIKINCDGIRNIIDLHEKHTNQHGKDLDHARYGIIKELMLDVLYNSQSLDINDLRELLEEANSEAKIYKQVYNI